ncbi:MAG: alanine racemase [Formosimonas sp.]
MPRPIVAKIYPKAIAHNLEKARATTHAKVWATIKANAYGHGIERVYSGLHPADGLAMLDFAEAQLVRELGWDKPVLMLEGCFSANDYQMAQALNLTVVIHHAAQIDWLAAAQLSQPLDVYLKMNSGMNRVGFAPADYAAAYQRLRALPHVGAITLMTHFANADLPNGVTQPLQIFNQTTAPLLQAQPTIQRSCSNSAAILRHAKAHFDWVRPGIMTYGGSPFGDMSAAQCGLQAAMSLESEVIALQHIKKGDAVGYGGQFVAPRDMTIGVVACGYADGYPRHAPNGTPVVVNGVRTTLAGRVSMDMITVDLTDVPNAAVGAAVELWGQNLPIDEVAQASGTIGYELMCALALRVPVVVEA